MAGLVLGGCAGGLGRLRRRRTQNVRDLRRRGCGLVADVGGFAEVERGEHRIEAVGLGVDAADIAGPDQ